MGRMNKKETIQFKQTIPANTNYSGVTALRQQIRAEGTLGRVSGRWNAGQQNQLQARPYIFMTGERSEDIVTYPQGTNKYIAGDNDSFDFPVDFELLPDFEIRIDVTNASAFPYTLDMNFEVDYVGGTARVV